MAVGRGQILSDEFGALDKLMAATAEQLTAIDQIGPVMAESVYEYLHDDDNVKVIEAMLAAGVKPTAPKEKASNILEGMTIVVTGTLKQFTRQQIEQMIKDHGGKTSSSVSKKTALLVAGENAGSKLDKAKKLGIETISESEFLKRIK
ncbi:MAG: BRCT domain-containing protein [Planctomycetota bacterium]|jgi:DNA ligase (NAD+)